MATEPIQEEAAEDQVDIQALVGSFSTNDHLEFERQTGRSVTDFGEDGVPYGQKCLMVAAFYWLLRRKEGNDLDLEVLKNEPPDDVAERLLAYQRDRLDPPTPNGG